MIKGLNYKELYKYLNTNNKLNQNQFIELKSHKNVDDVNFWGVKNGYNEYTVTILKDNNNIFENDIEIYVKRRYK